MEYSTRIIIVTVIAVLAAVGCAPLYADHVFLKNGAIKDGSITNETAAFITVKTKDGKMITYKKSDVLRTLYTQLYMGKLHMNLVDGKVLECYIVDEDRDNYKIRMDINKPEEITIRRTDVLFMVRKNPSALTGIVSRKYADLAWNKPYNPVKYYKIYVKARDGALKQAGETRSTRFRLKGLNCNMDYTAVVTAVDRDNYESLPSNELPITTEKGKPSPPQHIRIAKMTSDKNEVYTAHLAWDRAEDPCGGVINDYCIYLKVLDEAVKKTPRQEANRIIPGKINIPAGYKLLGKTSADKFQIQGLKDSTSYSILATSIDNTKEESDPGKELIFDTGIRRPQYPFPLACEQELSKDKKTLTAALSWSEVADPFRRITAYRVYRKGAKGPEQIGTTDKTEYKAAGLPPEKKQTFTVRAIDVRGIESEDSYAASTGLLRYVDISAKAGCVMPLRDYGLLYYPGYCVSLSVSVENVFYPGIALGVETGYASLSGKTARSTFTSMVPVKANMIYRWQPARWFSIDPKVSLGASYNTSDYNYYQIGFRDIYLLPKYVRRSQAEFVFSVGLDFTVIIKKIILLHISAEYGGIVEKNKVMDFLMIGGGAGANF
jgi:hypothetical protein